MLDRFSLSFACGLALILAVGVTPTLADTWVDYSDIGPDLLAYENAYPSLCKRHDLGLSYQGRHLWALQISDNVLVEEDEPEFKYISTMHGDEITGVKMCMLLIDYLMTNYPSDSQVQNIVDNVELWIVPLMNPDGYDRVTRTRYNAQGYDLNRNFPEWMNGDPNDPTGRPTEVQVIMNWSAQHTFTASANFHGGALVVNYPFDNDGLGSVYSPSPDEDMFVYISEQYSQYNLPMWNGSFYHGITNGAAWYSIDGGMQDWNYRYMGNNEVTIELGTKEPAASTIPTYWNDNRDSMLAYIETCLIGVRGIVTDGVTDDPLEATVRVVGRDHDIYTDPEVGDYHRMLMPGSYSLTFSAPGNYADQTIDNVVVSAGAATRLDVQMFPPQSPPITHDVQAPLDMNSNATITLDGADPYGDPIEFIVTSLPAHGQISDPGSGAITSVPYTVVVNGDQVVYTADADYIGDDSFSFKATDGGTPPLGGESNVSDVNIIVMAPPPVILTAALPDAATGIPYGPLPLEKSGGQPVVSWSMVTLDGPHEEAGLGYSDFAAVGTARGWHGDDNRWDYTLPFAFPFYDGSYTNIRICANGIIDFGSFSGSSYNNATSTLINNKAIAPLWDDLTTAGGYDIYIDTSVSSQVTIRWDAATINGNHPVDVSVTLVDDGTIRFSYGGTNTVLSPTIGISKGDTINYTLASYNNATSLTNADTLEFTRPNGLPDGLTFGTTGDVVGTPTETGTFQPIFRLSDSLGRTDQKTIELVVNAEPFADGDYDNDGDVDLLDFGGFQRCVVDSGPAACQDSFDFVPSGIIDQADLEWLADRITGPR